MKRAVDISGHGQMPEIGIDDQDPENSA